MCNTEIALSIGKQCHTYCVWFVPIAGVCTCSTSVTRGLRSSPVLYSCVCYSFTDVPTQLSESHLQRSAVDVSGQLNRSHSQE